MGRFFSRSQIAVPLLFGILFLLTMISWHQVSRVRQWVSDTQLFANVASNERLSKAMALITSSDQIQQLQESSEISLSTTKVTRNHPQFLTSLLGKINSINVGRPHPTVRITQKHTNGTLSVINEVVLSDQYPFLVWENLGRDLHYRLVIGENSYEIHPTEDNIIRVRIWPFSGKRPFSIEVFEEGEYLYTLNQQNQKGDRVKHTLVWRESQTQEHVIDELAHLSPENFDDFIRYGRYLEDEKMWVAAMDHYQNYQEQHPTSLDATPYLFRVYKQLKLKKAYSDELSRYRFAMMQ